MHEESRSRTRLIVTGLSACILLVGCAGESAAPLAVGASDGSPPSTAPSDEQEPTHAPTQDEAPPGIASMSEQVAELIEPSAPDGLVRVAARDENTPDGQVMAHLQYRLGQGSVTVVAQRVDEDFDVSAVTADSDEDSITVNDHGAQVIIVRRRPERFAQGVVLSDGRMVNIVVEGQTSGTVPPITPYDVERWIASFASEFDSLTF